MHIQGLDHFGIDVRNLAKAEDFYCGVLGLQLDRRLGDQILMRCGNQMLALFERPDLPPPDPVTIRNPLGKSHHAFLVSEADFAEAQRRFAERAVPCHTPIHWGDHECLYFLDPDGNLLELVTPPR